MEVIDLKLKGLKLFKPKVFRDSRGFFMETFQESIYKKHGLVDRFQQDNHSYSIKNCLRGMHFQSYPGQGKLVRAPIGKIFDVAVDIRPDSKTFGQWEGVILDDEEHHQLFVPVGFAHGFMVLSDFAHVMYKVTEPYHPDYEKGFRWDDPDVMIQWPSTNPIVSDRDRHSPRLSELKR